VNCLVAMLLPEKGDQIGQQVTVKSLAVLKCNDDVSLALEPPVSVEGLQVVIEIFATLHCYLKCS
jgi:hypothetical protein